MVTKKKYFIVSSTLEEIEDIANSLPEEYSFEALLASATTGLNQQLHRRINSLQYYDDLIDSHWGEIITNDSQAFYNSWYLNQSGENMTQVNGINFAQVLFPSIEILLVAYNRYFRGFSLSLEDGATVFISRNLHPNIVLALTAACQNKGVKLEKISVKNNQKNFFYGKSKLKLIFEIGWRDLSPYFLNRSIKPVLAHWISCIANIIIKYTEPTKASALIFQTGKMESFFNYALSHSSPQINIIFPFAINPRIYLTSKKLTYQFHSFTLFPSYSIFKLKKKIVFNIQKQNFPSEYLTLIESNLFSFLPGIKKYYQTARRQLKYLKPSVVLLTAEENESNLLLAQAAKSLKIKTAVTSHGYNFWGYKTNKTGKEAIFDYCLSFGQKDFNDYLEQGVPKERIIISSHPYFSKFLPFKTIQSTPFKKALILPLDFMITGPTFKVGAKFSYINKVIELLTSMNIEIIGLKVRESAEYSHSNLTNFYEYNDIKVPLYSGYSNFIDVVQAADFVIGPLSTAFIESYLMGKTYFNFWPLEDFNAIPFVCSSSFKMIHIAKNIDELKTNIDNKLIFKDNYCLDDMLYHSSLTNKNSLEEYYISSLLKCISETR